ncbi:hypothetical protein H0A43_09400 [Arcobacter lanthieri]|uniref:hypothetical protein n=1 Tax=Aliarcobacter lanthieri TaxID=1355374 RepID=UPI0019239BD8|nr:hypothetical protein [Aliarcobacter lanthieri]MBL3520687.1 hypothetical protein [Aliarcobacter lanthieri]
MYKLLQIVFITVFTIFVFSGCTVYSMQGEFLSLNPDTIQNPKKDISFEVSNVKLSKDLPNYSVHGFLIEEHNIKKSLQENLYEFYPQEPNLNPYRVELSMDFERDGFILDINVKINAIYKIYKYDNLIKTIQINSEYRRKESELNFHDNLFKAICFGIPDELKNDSKFKKEYLEYTAYSIDGHIAYMQEYSNYRLRYAYAGAIRLNFAKFIQELNSL